MSDSLTVYPGTLGDIVSVIEETFSFLVYYFPSIILYYKPVQITHTHNICKESRKGGGKEIATSSTILYLCYWYFQQAVVKAAHVTILNSIITWSHHLLCSCKPCFKTLSHCKVLANFKVISLANCSFDIP